MDSDLFTFWPFIEGAFIRITIRAEWDVDGWDYAVVPWLTDYPFLLAHEWANSPQVRMEIESVLNDAKAKADRKKAKYAKEEDIETESGLGTR